MPIVEVPQILHSSSAGHPLPRVAEYHSISADYDRAFSYADATAYVTLPNVVRRNEGQEQVVSIMDKPMVELTGLVLISLSEHRDVYPVAATGTRGIKGFTEGHVTVAGSLGFVTFGKNAFYEVIQYFNGLLGVGPNVITLPQQLPPIDLLIVFSQPTRSVERGVVSSYLFLKSVRIVDSARGINIQDIHMTENYSFIARGSTLLFPDDPAYVIQSQPVSHQVPLGGFIAPLPDLYRARKPAPQP